MKKNIICLLCVLIWGIPGSSAGENYIPDAVGGSGVQQDPSSLDFHAGPKLSSSSNSRLREESPFEKGTTLPYVTSMPKTIGYPRWARRQGFQGRLVVVIEVLEDGSVGRWRIGRSTGDERLDRTSAETIATWKFQPALQKGKPVKTCIEIPVQFELIR